MAPTKTTTKKSNKTSGKRLGATKDTKSRVSKPGSSSGRSSSKDVKRPPPTQQKSKPPLAGAASKTKKRRHYTEKELGIPQLNMVTPLGVQKPTGKKKGKVFVDDAQSMMTIMAMVNAEKEGQIESKMLRARQMEEIRTLKRQEQEEREAQRKEKLEATKDSLRKKRVRKGLKMAAVEDEDSTNTTSNKDGKKKKRVSFG